MKDNKVNESSISRDTENVQLDLDDLEQVCGGVSLNPDDLKNVCVGVPSDLEKECAPLSGIFKNSGNSMLKECRINPGKFG